jgi:hypothetical protein
MIARPFVGSISNLQSRISNRVAQRVVAFLRFADVAEFADPSAEFTLSVVEVLRTWVFDAEGEVRHGVREFPVL